jgi:hypothetical protein
VVTAPNTIVARVNKRLLKGYPNARAISEPVMTRNNTIIDINKGLFVCTFSY